jgi:uncharacterized protein YacL
MNTNEQQTKYVVMDTSTLMEYPFMLKVANGKVYVPLTVIKQLDGLKNSTDFEKSRKAREASFYVEEGTKSNEISVLIQYDKIDGLDNESDNKIVGAAVRLMKTNPGARVALFSTDRNMRIAASGYGIVVSGPELDDFIKVKKIRTPFYCRVLILVGVLLTVMGGLFLLSTPDGLPLRMDGTMVVLGIILYFSGIVMGMRWRARQGLSFGRKGEYKNKANGNSADEGPVEDIVSRNLKIGIDNPDEYVNS